MLKELRVVDNVCGPANVATDSFPIPEYVLGSAKWRFVGVRVPPLVTNTRQCRTKYRLSAQQHLVSRPFLQMTNCPVVVTQRRQLKG